MSTPVEMFVRTSMNQGAPCESVRQFTYQKENDIEYYNSLFERFNGNLDDIAEYIIDGFGPLEDGEYCGV